MDGYLQTKHKECRDMLHRVTNYIILTFTLFFIHGCDTTTSKELSFKKASINVIGSKEYSNIYNKISDTLKMWNKYNLYKFSRSYKQIFEVDSLLCFNSKGDRLRGVIHVYSGLIHPSENLYFLLGEKINNEWYYFTTATVVLPRKLYQKTDSMPLPASKMHELSIKEVLDGYLKPNGEINEDFFTREFEGPDWGVYPETLEDVKKLTRKDFEQRHLQYVKNNWNFVKKDTSSTLQ